MKSLPFLLVFFLVVILVAIRKPERQARATLSTTRNCPEPEEITSKWDLWAHGTCLRGANIWQKIIERNKEGNYFGSTSVGPPYAQSDFDELSDLGANAVNISHPGLYTETPPYQWNDRASLNLDRLLARIEKADLFAVISFRTGPGRTEADFSPRDSNDYTHFLWKDPEARKAWSAMWKKTARRYRNNPIVVGYQLMVEPNVNKALFQIWDPKLFYPKYQGSVFDWNTWVEEMVDAIRSEDENTPILACSLDSCSPEWLNSLKVNPNRKIVPLIHQYSPSAFTQMAEHNPAIKYPGNVDRNGDGEIEEFSETFITRTLEPIGTFQDATQLPVAVGEFGAARWAEGAEVFLEDQMNQFEKLGMNHFVWLWESSWPLLDYDQFNLKHGTDPNQHARIDYNPLISTMHYYWLKNRIGPNLVKDRFH